jgi:hypothetical protein
MGEMQIVCESCYKTEFKPHSCGNRHCPTCQSHLGPLWAEKQIQKLLSVDYYMVTFTVPYEMRKVGLSNQKAFYDAFFDSTSHTLKTLGEEKKWLGGKIGFTGVLHTHARDLSYHPHIHFILPGLAFDTKTNLLYESKGKYIFPHKVLSFLYTRLFLENLESLKIQVPEKLKSMKFNVGVQHVGKGEEALKYLSRYLYRGVISEWNIKEESNGQISFSFLLHISSTSNGKIKNFEQ